MRTSIFIASLACAALSTEVALADDKTAPAQPPVAQPTDQPAQGAQQPPVAGQQPPVAGQGGASGGGQTIIVVQGSGSPAAPAPKREREDGVRFRGGIGLEGGIYAIPEVGTNLGGIGPYGHIGVQINDLVGIFDVPAFDIMFGHFGGVNVSDAIVVDFTIADRFTVGVGPDVGAFFVIGGGPGGVGAGAGAAYGARIHLAAYPAIGKSDFAPRRRAFSIGLDTRLLGGPLAFAETTTTTASAAAGIGFSLHAMLTIGYEAI